MDRKGGLRRTPHLVSPIGVMAVMGRVTTKLNPVGRWPDVTPIMPRLLSRVTMFPPCSLVLTLRPLKAVPDRPRSAQAAGARTSM